MTAQATPEMWPLRIQSFQPSHRQFRLDENITAEEISKALGVEPIERDGDKVTLEWKFWAEATFPKPDGGHLSTSIGCKIWDYQGSRWSAYGWPEAFETVGLTPLLSQDYGSWKYDEDGNETLRLIAKALQSDHQQAELLAHAEAMAGALEKISNPLVQDGDRNIMRTAQECASIAANALHEYQKGRSDG